MISQSLSLLQYEKGNCPEPSPVELHVAKSPCTTPRPATVEDVTGFDSEDEEFRGIAKGTIDRLDSVEENREYFVDYCKQVCSFMFFVTGGLDHQSLRACFPKGIYPTLEEMKRIVGIIGEIKDRLVNGLGVQMVMWVILITQVTATSNVQIRGLLEDPIWSTDPVPRFDTQNDRINYFIYVFEHNPLAVLDLMHEINPALDIHFILSEHTYEGEQADLNALKTKLRAHIYIRLALLADLIFYGYFIRIAGPDEDSSCWVSLLMIHLPK
jgi:hypothetical protein